MWSLGVPEASFTDLETWNLFFYGEKRGDDNRVEL